MPHPQKEKRQAAAQEGMFANGVPDNDWNIVCVKGCQNSAAENRQEMTRGCVQMSVSVGTLGHPRSLGNANQNAYPKIKKTDHAQVRGGLALGPSCPGRWTGADLPGTRSKVHVPIITCVPMTGNGLSLETSQAPSSVNGQTNCVILRQGAQCSHKKNYFCRNNLDGPRVLVLSGAVNPPNYA